MTSLPVARFLRKELLMNVAGSLFSTIFGSKFPGNGCIYLAQSLTFKKPIFLNDVVKATVSVSSIDRDKRRLIFDTICEVGETLWLFQVTQQFGFLKISLQVFVTPSIYSHLV